MRRLWGTPILSLVVVALLLWIIGPLKPFQDCIKERKNYHPYNALRDEHLLIVKTRLRLRLHAACAVNAANVYQSGLIVLSGVLVAGFTGTLWWATIGMLRVGKRQHAEMERVTAATRTAAEAAMKSAQVAEASLTILERPILVAYVRPFKIGYVTESASMRTTFPRVGIDFRNYGKTPAIIDHAVADVILSNSIPDNSIRANRGRLRWHIDAVLHGESMGDLQVEAVGNPFSTTQKEGIQLRTTFVWFCGYVRFTDVFDALHTTYFMFQYDPAIDAFIRHGAEGQNRTERQPSQHLPLV